MSTPRIGAKGLSSRQVAEQSGATIEQLNYWALGGVLTPFLLDGHRCGRGQVRRYDSTVVPVARVLRQVSDGCRRSTNNGVSLSLLQSIVFAHSRGIDRVRLGDNVTLVWSS